MRHGICKTGISGIAEIFCFKLRHCSMSTGKEIGQRESGQRCRDLAKRDLEFLSLDSAMFASVAAISIDYA